MNTKHPHQIQKTSFEIRPAEEQKRIIDLCDQHTYHEALNIIAQPRPGGLQLQSSYGAPWSDSTPAIISKPAPLISLATSDKSTIIQSQPPANPHDPLISA